MRTRRYTTSSIAYTVSSTRLLASRCTSWPTCRDEKVGCLKVRSRQPLPRDSRSYDGLKVRSSAAGESSLEFVGEPGEDAPAPHEGTAWQWASGIGPPRLSSSTGPSSLPS